MFVINNINKKKMYWKKYSFTQHMNKVNMIKEINITFKKLDKGKITIKDIRKKYKKDKYLYKISNIITDNNINLYGYYTYQI